MALKPITRQEQIIAGKNLEPITRMERFLKEYGGGSSGTAQSDWNQTDSSAADFIKNKPFGDMPTGGDTLYWDGNTEGLVSSESFYKVSDAVPTMDDLANGAVLGISDSEIFEIPADAIMDGTVDGFPCIMIGEVFVALEDETNLDGFYFPQKGVYFACGDGSYISSLTIPGYTGFPVTKKIEEKYLPEPTTFYAGLEDSYLYTDVNCTVKATAAELRASMPNLLISAMGAMTYYPAFVYDAGTHMTVMAVVATHDGMAIAGEFYTAEYVPEG